jgi:hypothetical protein
MAAVEVAVMEGVVVATMGVVVVVEVEVVMVAALRKSHLSILKPLLPLLP